MIEKRVKWWSLFLSYDLFHFFIFEYFIVLFTFRLVVLEVFFLLLMVMDINSFIN